MSQIVRSALLDFASFSQTIHAFKIDLTFRNTGAMPAKVVDLFELPLDVSVGCMLTKNNPNVSVLHTLFGILVCNFTSGSGELLWFIEYINCPDV